MICCLVASFLLAQCTLVLRRWGMFWGIVAVPEGLTARTFRDVLRAWLASPRVRMAVTAAVLVELLAFGSWVYFRHGQHIYEFADVTISRLRGQHVVYVGLCGSGGREESVRLVLGSVVGPNAS